MLPHDITITGETPEDDDAIEALHEAAFGPGRFARAAARLREQGPHDPRLSLVARRGPGLAGSVRLTPIGVGAARGHLLGPLAVAPGSKNVGIGGALIERSCALAAETPGLFVLLVGDAPYYGRHGFAPVRGPHMPGPVDPARLLVRWHGDPVPLAGRVRHARRG